MASAYRTTGRRKGCGTRAGGRQRISAARAAYLPLEVLPELLLDGPIAKTGPPRFQDRQLAGPGLGSTLCEHGKRSAAEYATAHRFARYAVVAQRNARGE